MAEMSNYLENALINGTLRATTYTAPTTIYVGLYTSDPTDANTGTEVSGGSYARTSVTFGVPSNGASLNSSAVEFPQATADWGTVGWIGLLDASTSGNLLCYWLIICNFSLINYASRCMWAIYVRAARFIW
jgi:hypothetical protein